MSSELGKTIKTALFGESHGDFVGATVDSFPSGYSVDLEKIQCEMLRRAPGNDSTATARKESDIPVITSGLQNGKTNGEPLRIIIKNENVNKSDYEKLRRTPRPSHADYAAYCRFGEDGIKSGGGSFSGRLTAPLVAAGSIAKQILSCHGITVGGHVLSVGEITDTPFDAVNIKKATLQKLGTEYFATVSPSAKAKMREEITAVKQKGDSIGGTVEIAVVGLKAGVGGLFFDGLEGRISTAVFGVPAVKGIEFGLGFGFKNAKGSIANDKMYYDENGKVKCHTNNCGGILGGLSSGMPIVFRVAIKPTPSIAIPQETVDLRSHKNTVITVEGRHDACIVPRALPAVEAATALAVLDILSEENLL